MLFESVPENFRPKCEEVDERGVCPKGVPLVFPSNSTAYELFAVLVGSAGFVEPELGLVKFDTEFVRNYLAILTSDERERRVNFLKVLLMVSVFNEKAMEVREKRIANADNTSARNIPNTKVRPNR